MINKLSLSSKNSMLTRILTGIVLMAVVIPCIAYGNWPFFVLSILLAIVGIHEILRAPGAGRYSLLVKVVVYVFVLSFIFWAFIKNWAGSSTPNPFNGTSEFYLSNIFVSILGIVLYAMALFLIAVSTPKFQLSDATYLFTVGLFFALGFQGMLFLRYFPNSQGITYLSQTGVPVLWGENVTCGTFFSDYYHAHGLNQTFNSCLVFIFMLLGTWGADVGAYFVGVLFGKHRMNPRISPHKTWEGFFGGFAFSMLCSLGFAAICEYSFQSPLVPGILQFQDSALFETINVMNGAAWPFLVGLAFLMPIVGNIGGFTFSLVKRQFGIKDFGNLFPGHGGVIDRFDSILTNSIMIAIVMVISANGWNLQV